MRDPAKYAVLVVEDDPAIRRLVSMVLGREGYRIETATDGVEAVLKLGVNEYDAIVLDLMLPKLDGFAVIETLAEHYPNRLRRIIVTSAAAPATILERMQGIRFNLLPKPFDIGELSSRVRSCIGQA